VLIWGDADLCSAEAECRVFWLQSRFAELPDRCPRRARPLQLVDIVPATPDALRQAYVGDYGYVKDSLYFLHREGPYCMSEPVTPLALMWRDRRISRFVVDTPDEKGEVLPERQAVVLELRGGGRLRTAERAVVACLEGEEVLRKAKELAQGTGRGRNLLRCEVESVDVPSHQLRGVTVVGHVPARSRIWPDSWNRIVFQHLHRSGCAGPISFEALTAAAAGA
jgi:hypothetical protein